MRDKTVEPGNTDRMGQNGGSIDATLKQRGSVYGDYGQVVCTRENILDHLTAHYHTVNGEAMPSDLRIILGDIILKLVRATSAPQYTDSWHDLAGYATLAEKYYEERNQTTKG